IHPSGNITLQGFSMTMNYYKDFFERFGIDVQWVRHGNYKTGGETFTKAYMSKEEKKQLSSYMAVAWKHWSERMEAMRHLEPGTLDRLCNDSFIFSATEANRTGLADEIWHRDGITAYLSDIYDGLPEHKIPFIPIKKYIRYAEYSRSKTKLVKEKVATVYMKGEIVPGTNKAVVSAEPFAQQLSRYRRDSTVKAVVIRMESPGGDPMASDVLARELELMRAVKPVVVSMGDVAASGGYWVSSSASEIFAEPFSMTGSIGVYSLYFNVEDALNRLLDIHPQAIHTHPYGNIYSFYHKKSPAALQIIQHSVNQTYDQFVETVSKNRGLSLSETEALADGRIWSGAEALEHKLVDHLGGMTQAVERAAQLAGLTQYRLTAYPKPLKISELIGLAGNTERIKAKSILDPIRDAVVSTLLKERGVRARLPFDEKALLW
ncbi:MAG: signal peptide peptidase SppA, partial [Bacteroidales bacterium]